MSRRFAILLLSIVACSSPDSAVAPVARFDVGREPSQGPAQPAARRSVVVLTERADAQAVARDHGLRPEYTYSHVLNGFAGTVSDAARGGLLRDSRVVAIEPDQEFSASARTQPAASWGLDRIDQRSGLDGSYGWVSTGRGVTVYVVDTGIRYSHHDFGGRASFGYDALGGDGVDCQGHGTHVAGTVGGTTYGVAKEVRLVGVRVLNCAGGGTTSGVIAGLDWVVGHASRPAVINLSLGGPADTLVDLAVRRATEVGIAVAVAAGNSTADACDYSPARVAEAMTIGATGSDDVRATWSNWGGCVDAFAPGVAITSDAYDSDDGTAVKSGTSMASPHVAGVAALFLETHPGASPAEVADSLSAFASKGAVSSAFSLTSDLVYTRWDLGWGGSGIPPVAAFTAACEALTCTFTNRSADADGSVVGYQWDFGDHFGELAASPTHAYAAAGTYTVRLIVRDDAGLTGTATSIVSVTAPAPSGDTAGIDLKATGSRRKGRRVADLAWTGATSAKVTVFLNGAALATTANTGSFHYEDREKGPGSYVFRVCEAGTTICSQERTVTY